MNLKRISVKLSWMLRHCQTPRYINLNGGWADVDDIIKALIERYPDFNRKTLELIVARDEKGRYSFDETGTKIRAKDFKSDGNELYRSSNGVWQARYVAPEYFILIPNKK